jgi:4'-phosphopantetheinyl transferase
MPFLKEFIINNYTKIILWKIIPGELDDKHLSKEEIGLLKIRKGKNSKEYFLAVRKLLENEDPELTIDYNLIGKPFLNKQKGISISHSNEIVAIAISNEIDFGIDIQYKTDKVFKIQNKFLSEMESKFLGKKNDLESLIKVWSAKESIYKALGKEGVSFSNDLEIDIINDKDFFRAGYYRKDNIKTKFDIDFIYIEEYIICYAKKS